jgi:amidase
VEQPVVANLRKAGAVIIGARIRRPAALVHAQQLQATPAILDRTITPGGSGGASAASPDIGAIAHGTDIAGSIRCRPAPRHPQLRATAGAQPAVSHRRTAASAAS